MKIIVLWVEAFVQGFEPPCFHFFVSEKPATAGYGVSGRYGELWY